MKKGKDQVVFNILAYVLVGLFAILCLVPFYLIVVGSFTSESTIVKEGYSFFLTVKNFSTEAYHLALKNPQSILHAYGVTIFVIGCGNTAFDLYDNDDRLCVVTSGIFRGEMAFFFLFLHDIIYGGLVPGICFVRSI